VGTARHLAFADRTRRRLLRVRARLDGPRPSLADTEVGSRSNEQRMISPMPSHLSVPVEITSGSLMVLAGVGAVAVAKWIWRIQFQWFCCGALLWAIAVAAKRFIAALTLGSVLGVFQNHLPHPMWQALGSGYIGLLTGITEPVVTLAAGLLWWQLTYDARRAVGIGLGAGGI